MNIGQVVKIIQKNYPSISISRIRFLEKEGLINISRSKGGTRKFSNKDIEKIVKIIELQEDKFYSLKAIKNNPSLLKNTELKNIKIKNFSEHELLRLSGISTKQFEDLLKYDFVKRKDKFNSDDLELMKSWFYFFSLGLEPKNFSVLKSISERTSDFIEFIFSLLGEEAESDKVLILNNFTNLIRSYSLKDS